MTMCDVLGHNYLMLEAIMTINDKNMNGIGRYVKKVNNKNRFRNIGNSAATKIYKKSSAPLQISVNYNFH